MFDEEDLRKLGKDINSIAKQVSMVGPDTMTSNEYFDAVAT